MENEKGCFKEQLSYSIVVRNLRRESLDIKIKIFLIVLIFSLQITLWLAEEKISLGWLI